MSRICSQKLKEAEKKIEILTKDETGQLKTEPFEPSPETEEPSEK